MRQVALHARPVLTGQRLHAELLQQVEQHAPHRLGRGQAPVQRLVAEPQAQGLPVGGAAERREVITLDHRVQVRRVQRQPRTAAVQAAAAEVQVTLGRQRADGRHAQLFRALLQPGGGLNFAHQPLAG